MMPGRVPGSIPRSACRGGSQARGCGTLRHRFGLAGRGQLLILPFDLTPRRSGRRPGKFGSPPLFAPSLKVQGDSAHDDSGFSVFFSFLVTQRLQSPPTSRSRVEGDGRNCVPNKNSSRFPAGVEIGSHSARAARAASRRRVMPDHCFAISRGGHVA